ncbi:MAG: DNA-protecting protein DprA [Candidatus Jacksonbacteria bacterium]|jgi:DNA processing protein|nr:DNA-protecting protein DprA [Candidatus Jacksonbacteria bacterium]MBT6034036.1 DNA-protecting protein DprA [Candidatus Jacksonbacteria bacterium]MBT6301341.1 DNA-protecting protein DprA [Candidatus Jacksonbacteria bacterium]MBT6756983.1 DNA-protecting protein DprA [Candidatus Jacksonbacteria bacterium]MBT6955581.1 DNA-protecting protein DprA [Candidatus Jacksonbacteria bacterium]
MESLYYTNAINLFYKFGPQRMAQIRKRIPEPQHIWEADKQTLIQTGVPEKVIDEFIAFRPTINIKKEWEKLDNLGVRMVTHKDDEYPELLKELYSPPIALYVRGTIPNESFPKLAIVGSRKVSTYGKQTTPDIAAQLAQTGIIIVSGLALGIDGLAHQAAVENNTPTIAVLGCSIDDASIYPRANYQLAHNIIKTDGAIISEYPLGTAPLKQHFPARNRIISGMSLGVLVIEATQQSGSLLTSRHALDQNREVFAIPGSIYNESSIGTNNLIKMGAHLVNNAQDIIDVLDLKTSPLFADDGPVTPDTYEESLLLPLLSKEPIHVDILVSTSTLDMAAVSATLTLMEMKGKVRNLGGMMYVRSK